MLSIREAVSQGRLSSGEVKERIVFQLAQRIEHAEGNRMSALSPDFVWVDDAGSISVTTSEDTGNQSRFLEYLAPERLFDEYYQKLGNGIHGLCFSLGLLIYYLYYGKSYYEQSGERVTDIPSVSSPKAGESLIHKRDCRAMPEELAQSVELLTSFLGDRKSGLALIENVRVRMQKDEPSVSERGQEKDRSRQWICVSVNSRDEQMIPLLCLDGSKGLTKKIRKVQTLRSIKFWKADCVSERIEILKEIQLEDTSERADCDLLIYYDLNSSVCHVKMCGAASASWEFSV